MDPTTAYDTMTNEALDLEERADAAAALVGWLNHGGVLPNSYTARNLDNDHDINRAQRTNARAKAATVLAEAWNQR